MIEILEARIAPANIIWTGTGSNPLWSNSANWVTQTTGIPVTPAPGDTLIFDDGAASFTAVNDTTPGGFYSVILNNNTAPYTLAGNAITLFAAGVVKNGFGTTSIAMPLTGGGGIQVNGGTLALGGTNTYAGGSTISVGILEVGNDQNLGGVGGISISNGGTLAATDSFTTGRNISLTGSGTVSVSANDTLSLSGIISDGGAGPAVLNTAGLGTVVLGAANTYSGGTQISSGTLSIASNANLGALVGDVAILGGARIEILNTMTISRDFALGANTTFVIPPTKTVTLSGVVSDSGVAQGSIAVVGGGVLLLTNAANTFSGSFAAPAGTIKLAGTTTTFSGPGTVAITMIPGTGDIASIVLSGTTLASKLTVNGPPTTSLFSISIPDPNDHIDTITLGKGVLFGDGVIDAIPDLFIAGKANAVTVVDVNAGAILKFGSGLPYDFVADTTTPDSYNNRPNVTIRDVLGSDVIIDVTGDGTPGGVGGGGLGKFFVRSWGFAGLVKTTQSIDTFTIKRGDSFAVLEVDKFHNGLLTPANVNKITCLAGKWNSAGTAIEGYVDRFEVGGFANAATLTAGYIQTKVLISGNYLEPGNIALGGTITLTSESPSALFDIRIGSFTGNVVAQGTVANFVCTGNFSGKLTADGIVTKVQALKFVDINAERARITTLVSGIGSVIATGGGMTNTIVQSAGDIGPITLTGSGSTRSMIGSTISAAGNIGIIKIGTTSSGANLSSSFILSGVNLGADGLVGGLALDADTAPLQITNIGDITIYGVMTGSVIAASISRVDGSYGNLDDTALFGGSIGKVSLHSAAFSGKTATASAPAAHTNAILGDSVNGVYQIGVGVAKIAILTSGASDVRLTGSVTEVSTDLLVRAF